MASTVDDLGRAWGRMTNTQKLRSLFPILVLNSIWGRNFGLHAQITNVWKKHCHFWSGQGSVGRSCHFYIYSGVIACGDLKWLQQRRWNWIPSSCWRRVSRHLGYNLGAPYIQRSGMYTVTLRVEDPRCMPFVWKIQWCKLCFTGLVAHMVNRFDFR